MNLTILITCFERPQCRDRLLESIKKYAPEYPVIVVDDSKEPNLVEGVTNVRLPFDSGVSAKRNAGLLAVTTDYVFILEDDCIFNEETDLTKALSFLEKSGADMLGIKASGVDYCGTYAVTKTLDGFFIKCSRDALSGDFGVFFYDFIPNIFVAKTVTLKQHPWDESLKMGEHFAFFWKYRGQLRIGFTSEVKITHGHIATPSYSQFRSRAPEYVRDFMRKNGIKRREDFHGVIEV